MGIRTPVSSNLAMTLGGLRQGVTPLDMAHAYETFAAGGKRVSGTLGTADDGPVGIRASGAPPATTTGRASSSRRTRSVGKRVLSAKLAGARDPAADRPGEVGTATRAQYGGFAAGKTGTTENYGDAWFVGFTDRWTVAVWVGYPDKLKPMTDRVPRQPVTGGTFPAHDLARLRRRRQPASPTTATPRSARSKGLPPESSRRRPSTVDPGADRAGAPAPREGAAPQGPGTTGGATGGTAPGAASRAGADDAQAARRRPPPPRRPRPPPRPRRPPRRRAPSSTPPAGDGGGTGGTGGTGARHRRRAPRRQPTVRGPTVARKPGGHGRDTWRLPAAQKRHGSSTAFVMPIRGPAIERRVLPARPRAGATRIGPSTRLRVVELEVDPERLGQLARARCTGRRRAPRRGARASARRPRAARARG